MQLETFATDEAVGTAGLDSRDALNLQPPTTATQTEGTQQVTLHRRLHISYFLRN